MVQALGVAWILERYIIRLKLKKGSKSQGRVKENWKCE